MKPVGVICLECYEHRAKKEGIINYEKTKMIERIKEGRCAFVFMHRSDGPYLSTFLGEAIDGVPKMCPYITEQTVAQEKS